MSTDPTTDPRETLATITLEDGCVLRVWRPKGGVRSQLAMIEVESANGRRVLGSLSVDQPSLHSVGMAIVEAARKAVGS